MWEEGRRAGLGAELQPMDFFGAPSFLHHLQSTCANWEACLAVSLSLPGSLTHLDRGLGPGGRG